MRSEPAAGVRARRLHAVTACLAGACLLAACGKKGAPLPPLVRVPVAPADFSAERRGEEVRLQFTVPGANTDGTRPANIEHVDVYRFTGPGNATDDDVVKLGTRVATVPVKAPANPDLATEPDEPAEEPDLKDEGLSQGAVAQLEDTIGPAPMTAVVVAPKDRKKSAPVAQEGPLVGPLLAAPSTLYVAVPFNTKGRKGPLSRRVRIPLSPPPAPPTAPAIAYTEETITVSWTASASAAGGDVLPSRSIGIDAPAFSYHVYDVSPSAVTTTPATGALLAAGQLRLTRTPVTATEYADNRVEWGVTRCYTVRTVETVGDLTLESDAPPPVCQTLTDTFPPAAPKDLRLIATEGVISLIWEPGSEPDLAGYLVLRGQSEDALAPITPMPISATTFNDMVPTGTRYWYAVRAVDRAGNASPPSNRVEELAR